MSQSWGMHNKFNLILGLFELGQFYIDIAQILAIFFTSYSTNIPIVKKLKILNELTETI